MVWGTGVGLYLSVESDTVLCTTVWNKANVMYCVQCLVHWVCIDLFYWLGISSNNS